MYPKNPLFQKCISYLESLPNIKAAIRFEPYASAELLADGELMIHGPHGTANYVCEIKTGIRDDSLEPVVEYFSHLQTRLEDQQRPLLVTRNLSNLVVDRFLEKNIEFIDVDGNLYLNSPALYAVIRNQASKENPNKNLEITAAALQVIYALLNRPELLGTPNIVFEEEISVIAGVTTKTVRSTLKKLQLLDYLDQKNGKPKIVDYVKLFERWELGYAERLRSKLLLGSFSPVGHKDFSEIEQMLIAHTRKLGYGIGGELAAALITNHLRPISATLHVHHTYDYRTIAVKLKLMPDPEGNILLFQDFNQDADAGKDYFKNIMGNDLINPFLIHAELVQTGNSRLKEAAQIIYDRYIEEIAQRHD